MADKKQSKRPTPKRAVELTEDALEQVTGGRKTGAGQPDTLKLTLRDAIISS